MKITCTRPNASLEISGIPFERQDDGSVVAKNVASELAESFVDFPGYSVAPDEPVKPEKQAKAHKEAKNDA